MILDTNGIQKILPHRYPFLMVDAILEMERFKRIVGVSPREYAEACRLARVKRGLRAGARVTDAMIDAGYASSSRFYDVFSHLYRRRAISLLACAALDTMAGTAVNGWLYF